MKYMKILWIIILVTDHLLPLIITRFYPNYKHKEMALSVLGSRQSPVKWIYNVWCIISGIVFCIAPYELYKENSSGLMIAIWVLLAIYGIGCEIISGFCPLNENKQDEYALTKIHGGASAIGFMTLLVVPLLLAILHFQATNIIMEHHIARQPEDYILVESTVSKTVSEGHGTVRCCRIPSSVRI